MLKVRAMRKAKGLTQVELAKRAGLNAATLHRIERGDENPRLFTLMRIARALNIHITDLFVAKRGAERIPDIEKKEADLERLLARVKNAAKLKPEPLEPGTWDLNEMMEHFPAFGEFPCSYCRSPGPHHNPTCAHNLPDLSTT